MPYLLGILLALAIAVTGLISVVVDFVVLVVPKKRACGSIHSVAKLHPMGPSKDILVDYLPANPDHDFSVQNPHQFISGKIIKAEIPTISAREYDGAVASGIREREIRYSPRRRLGNIHSEIRFYGWGAPRIEHFYKYLESASCLKTGRLKCVNRDPGPLVQSLGSLHCFDGILSRLGTSRGSISAFFGRIGGASSNLRLPNENPDAHKATNNSNDRATKIPAIKPILGRIILCVTAAIIVGAWVWFIHKMTEASSLWGSYGYILLAVLAWIAAFGIISIAFDGTALFVRAVVALGAKGHPGRGDRLRISDISAFAIQPEFVTKLCDMCLLEYVIVSCPSIKINMTSTILHRLDLIDWDRVWPEPLYQLTQVTQGATTTESYTYDAVGNRLSSVGVPSYSYNSSNELTSNSAASFTYDNNGNTLTKADSTGSRTYTWDFENRLASVGLPGTAGTATFKYDPFGRRIQKIFTQNSIPTITSYIYDGANSIEEVDVSGNELARYSQADGIDEPVDELRPGTTAFYEQDGLGSITSLSGPTGSLASSYTYDAFGNITETTGSMTNSLQYTGRDYDSETGLRYYRARYYDAQTGHFLSEDPVGFAAGLNFYRYVGNNPVRFRDPSGENPGALVLPWLVPAGEGILGVICFGSGVCETVIVVGGVVVGVGALAYLTYDLTHRKAKAKPSPRCKEEKDDKEDCPRQWKNARDYCAGLLSMPRNSPEWKNHTEIWGGSFEACVRGQVAERCGGNRVE